MATQAKAKEEVMTIVNVEKGVMEFCIVGTSPLIFNRMAKKAREVLLLGGEKKNAAVKAAQAKHDPLAEFRDSPYRMRDPKAPTALAVLPSWFKQGMGTAALRLPGTQKTAMLQLVNVPWENEPVYGIPKVLMSVVRSADINKTPDIRTRAILPEWACKMRIEFIRPIMRETAVTNLLVAAGYIAGCGDWRQEKGSGSYGSYRVCSADDPDFVRICKTMGRTAQLKALEEPESYDDETDELMAFYEVEIKRRGFKVAA